MCSIQQKKDFYSVVECVFLPTQEAFSVQKCRIPSFKLLGFSMFCMTVHLAQHMGNVFFQDGSPAHGQFESVTVSFDYLLTLFTNRNTDGATILCWLESSKLGNDLKKSFSTQTALRIFIFFLHQTATMLEKQACWPLIGNILKECEQIVKWNSDRVKVALLLILFVNSSSINGDNYEQAAWALHKRKTLEIIQFWQQHQ